MDSMAIRNKINAGVSIYDLDLRVVYYARVSTDKDAQLNSLDNQIFYFDDFIKKQKKWTLVDGYVDEGISGKSAENRDSFMRMIRDAKARKFDLIITKEISRFSRNTLDSISYTRQLLDCGVGVFFQSDNINTLMPDSELRLTIMASIAQEEVRKLSERLRFGYKRSIEKGRVLGQDNMLGYDKADGKLTINEVEAAMIRRLFEIYNEGKKGLRAVSRQLEQEGFISPNTGEMFGYGTLQHVLTNPKYKGYYCSRKTVSVDFRDAKKRRMPQEDWIVYKDENIPAIVSEEIWDKANELYQQRSKKIKEQGGSFSTRYPLSGKIFCGEHGTSYHRHVYKSKKNGEQEVWNCRMYRLKGKVDGCDSPTLYTTEINKILYEIYEDIFANKEIIVDRLMKRYDGKQSRDYVKTITECEKQISALDAKKDKLLDLMMDDSISREEFKKRNDTMNQEIAELTEKINSHKNAQDTSTQLKKNLGSLQNYFEQAITDPDAITTDISKTYLDKITVHKIDGDKRHVKLEIRLNIGKTYEAERVGNDFILSQEIGKKNTQIIERKNLTLRTRIKRLCRKTICFQNQKLCMMP